jgi:hypothetical protein
VLDNCSSDGTSEWLRTINDPRLQIHRIDRDLSIEQNWARVRDVQKNEFMTMIGHDDVLRADFLSIMDDLIKKHPAASLYQAHFRYIDEKGATTRLCLPMDEIQRAHEFLACQMNNTIDSTGTGYVMRSEDFDRAGGMPTNYPNLIYADYHLWISLMSKSYKATTPTECFQYREHNSVSRITDGDKYAAAFHEYVRFLHSLKGRSPEFANVIDRYGHSFLMKMCESLAHRLLKTPAEKRTMSVLELTEQFKSYAQLLLPKSVFDPLTVPRIKYAYWIDVNPATRSGFRWFKKIFR